MKKLKYRVFFIFFYIKSIFIKRKIKRKEEDYIYPI